MITLYGFHGSASLAPHLVLEELGVPYQFVRLDQEKGEHKQPAYLQLNPLGRVPALVDDGQALFESAAICLHLCDRHPSTHLIPPVGDARRSQVYKWMVYLTNTLQTALMSYFYPERFSTDASHAAAIKQRAEQLAQESYRFIEAELDKPGPYLLGNDVSVADLYLMMLVRWGRWFDEPPARLHPRIARLVSFLSERAAVQRAFAAEGIPAPYCLLPA